MDSDKRLLWPDILKGIGILAVIIAHVSDGFIRDFIFIFHMPLFFFIGGYFFKNNESTKKLKDKIDSLLIPYISYLLLISTPFIIKDIINVDIDGLYTQGENILLGGEYLTGMRSVFWFVTCYLFTYISYFFICSIKNKFTINFFILILLLASYYLSYNYEIKFIGCLNVALFTVPIFHLGYNFRIYNIFFYKYSKVFLIIVLFIFSYLATNIEVLNEIKMDLKYSNYGVFLLSLFISLLIVLSLIKLSIKISKFNFLSGFLSYLGTYSLVVMYLHQPIQITLRTKFGLVSEILIIFLTVLICIIFIVLINKYQLTKYLFLGKK